MQSIIFWVNWLLAFIAIPLIWWAWFNMLCRPFNFLDDQKTTSPTNDSVVDFLVRIGWVKLIGDQPRIKPPCWKGLNFYGYLGILIFCFIVACLCFSVLPKIPVGVFDYYTTPWLDWVMMGFLVLCIFTSLMGFAIVIYGRLFVAKHRITNNVIKLGGFISGFCSTSFFFGFGLIISYAHLFIKAGLQLNLLNILLK